jgi:endonuclease-3 related protein
MRQLLLGVNGIGRETADSIVLYAAEKPVFVVDAYTRRAFSRHGLISGEEDYDEIRALFENNLPADVQLYNEYHALIVRLGKEFCRPKPQCAKCPLNEIPH